MRSRGVARVVQGIADCWNGKRTGGGAESAGTGADAAKTGAADFAPGGGSGFALLRFAATTSSGCGGSARGAVCCETSTPNVALAQDTWEAGALTRRFFNAWPFLLIQRIRNATSRTPFSGSVAAILMYRCTELYFSEGKRCIPACDRNSAWSIAHRPCIGAPRELFPGT